MQRFEKACVLVAYAALSFGFFGWRLLPHPGRVVLGDQNAPLYIWSFGWWQHALGSLTNPFVTHSLYDGAGVDIAWTPSAPGLALVFSPLTALVGPVAAFNVASVLVLALSAWTAYLLCRYLTGSLWASLIGGYLFGFSTAELRQLNPGNLNLSAVFLFPLIALVLVRFVRSELSSRGLALRLGLLLAFQLTISTEFVAMASLAIAVGLVLSLWLLRDLRPRIRAAIPPVMGAYAIAAVAASPFVYYLLSDFNSHTVVSDIQLWGTDALASIVPSFVNAIGGNDLQTLQSHVPSHSAYLGVPLVAIIVLYAVRAWHSAAARFLLATFAAAAVATLGASLTVYGHTLFTLPWWTAVSHVPALNDMLPFRFAILEALAAGVIAAVWISGGRGLFYSRPFVLPVLAAVAITPAVWKPSAFTPLHHDHPSFFTGAAARCVPENETIAILPYSSNSLILQAESGFRFKLPQAGLQAPGDHFGTGDPVIADLSADTGYVPIMDRLLAFAGVHRVDRIVSLETAGYPTFEQMSRFGKPDRVGGVIVSPGCGSPSLMTRDLQPFVRTWELQRPIGRKLAWCLDGTFVTVPYGLAPAPSRPSALASFVQGKGLTCDLPPPGYTLRGSAPASLGVPEGTYKYYAP